MEITLKPTKDIQRIRLPLKVQVLGDIYPTKYIGKTNDTFGRLKFQFPVNLPL